MEDTQELLTSELEDSDTRCSVNSDTRCRVNSDTRCRVNSDTRCRVDSDTRCRVNSSTRCRVDSDTRCRVNSESFKPVRKARSMRIADVVFIVGPDCQRFLAHRMLLSMQSPVFLEMFYGEIPVTDKEITFTNVSSSGFKSMLNFFYDENFKIRCIQEAVETFVVARKFKVCPLEEICESYVKTDTPLSPDSVCVLYDLARTAEMHSLMYNCLKMIDKQTKSIISSESFINASGQTVLDIVKRPFLTINCEGQLLSALRKWVISECQRQGLENNRENILRMLQPFLRYIRWREISSAQVSSLNLPDFTKQNIPSSEEPLYSTVDLTLGSDLCLNPRAPAPYYRYRLRHTELPPSMPFVESESLTLEISVSMGSAYVCGVSLWLKPVIHHRLTSLKIRIQAENTSTGHCRKTNVHLMNTLLLAVVVFDKPLFVTAGQHVILVATVVRAKNLLTSVYSGYLETVELEDLTLTILPRSPPTCQKMCIFKELMFYF